MHVEVLGFAECPNTPEFWRRIEAAARTVNGVVVEYVNQEALGADDPRRGYPTPTALVNGRDLFGLPPPAGPNLGCRLYPGGLPDEEAITARLRAAQSRPRPR